MADAKPAVAADPLKFGAGLLFLCGALFLMFHRMPHHEYAAVHEDKPRPKVVKETPDAAPAVKPAAKPAETVAPDKRALGAQDPATIPSSGSGVATKREVSDACASEIGLFCYHVPAANVRRCLTSYDTDVYLNDCREALGIKNAQAEP